MKTKMAEATNRLIAIDSGDSKVSKTLTDKPPAHFTLKINSFSLLYKTLVVEAKAQSYESEVFEAGGYKWKFSLYPNGDKANNGTGYISLYLIIVDTHSFPKKWKVCANLKFFLYDHHQNKYLTFQDANAVASSFHAKKTGFGFSRLLPLSSFLHTGNGYLVNGKCIFGAEVLVKNYVGTDCTVESLGLLKAPYTWKIDNFSSLSNEYLHSDAFTVGNRNWKLLLYPKGDSFAKKSTLSVFLKLVDLENLPELKAFAINEFRVVNQCGGNDIRMKSFGCCFSKTSPSWGYSVFLPLADLHDPSKGFLVNDTLIIQAQIDLFSPDRSIFKTTEVPDQGSEKLQQTNVNNHGTNKITVINFSSGAAKAEKLLQGNVKKEGLTKTAGKNSAKKSGTEAFKEIVQHRRPWFKRWFF